MHGNVRRCWIINRYFGLEGGVESGRGLFSTRHISFCRIEWIVTEWFWRCDFKVCAVRGRRFFNVDVEGFRSFSVIRLVLLVTAFVKESSGSRVQVR